MKENPSESQSALCIENRECDDLEKRKIYQILPDEEAAQKNNIHPRKIASQKHIILLNNTSGQFLGVEVL